MKGDTENITNVNSHANTGRNKVNINMNMNMNMDMNSIVNMVNASNTCVQKYKNQLVNRTHKFEQIIQICSNIIQDIRRCATVQHDKQYS